MGATSFTQAKPLKLPRQVLSGISRFYLVFQSNSTDWRFLKNRNLYALADSQRFHFGEGDHDYRIGTRSVSESLAFKLSAEDFYKIASARSVELQISSLELKLKDEQLEAFRDLYSLSRS